MRDKNRILYWGTISVPAWTLESFCYQTPNTFDDRNGKLRIVSFHCGEDVIIWMYFKIFYPVIPYTRHPRRCRVPMLFSKLQVSNENRKRVAGLLVSCRCVLSAVGLSMASLKRYSVEMSYVQLSHVVTPHKLLIKEKSTYPVRNPSCCCGKRLKQRALPCTVKLQESRVYLVRT